MSCNFEFLKDSTQLIKYYQTCEELETCFANGLYKDCYCSVKRVIEESTFDACTNFDIPKELDAKDDFTISGQWSNTKWLRFINEDSLAKDIKELIKKRNKIEHIDSRRRFVPDESDTIEAMQILRDFFVILIDKYNDIILEFDKVEKPKNLATEKLKKAIRDRDDAIKEAAETKDKASKEKAEHVKKTKAAEKKALEEELKAKEEAAKRKIAELERNKTEEENKDLRNKLKNKPTIVVSNKLEYGVRAEL